jgi:NADPH:quinone reductase-like Zn-dependent oxidoreductase
MGEGRLVTMELDMETALEGYELRSVIAAEGRLQISLEPVTVREPGRDEVVVRVEAAPINPSDQGLLFGPADPATLRAEGATLVAAVPARRLSEVQARIGQSLPVGNEGAGTVVRAGSNQQHLIGRKVGMIGGAMYATYRLLPARDCIVLPDDVSAAEGAALFVNPLTALGFVETMRRDGHHAIVHTAAASNLGQMLVRVCQADDIALVNIVRSEEQVALLRGIGAVHVLNSNDPDFRTQLVDAIAATDAFLGFDPIGGGKLAGQILHAMEQVASRQVEGHSRYGSDRFKQVYIYGALDSAPTILNRSFGFAWAVGGWLLFPFLEKAGAETAERLRRRVASEIKTTFASHYSATISLADVLKPESAAAYLRKGTGDKYLIDPTL